MNAAAYFLVIDMESEAGAIARGLRRRDPPLLDRLIEQYQHRLLRYLLYLARNRELAEDLFQETWLRANKDTQHFSDYLHWRTRRTKVGGDAQSVNGIAFHTLRVSWVSTPADSVSRIASQNLSLAKCLPRGVNRT